MVVKQTAERRGFSDEAIAVLRAEVKGEVIHPEDSEYEGTRRTYMLQVERYPAIVVRAAGVGDVVKSVQFARAHGLPVSVRSGGHGFSNYGTPEHGVLIDISAMNRVEVDPAGQTAWAEAGAKSSDLAAAAQPHGLALTTGDTATVGLGGLTTGGGIGWIVRKQGLTIDNLLEAQVVTADGRVVRASADENPDLFWAVRGGGGNFGVVTKFHYRLHPVGSILGGALMFPATGEYLHAWSKVAAEAPDDLTTIVFVGQAPPLPFVPADLVGTPVITVMPVWAGDLDEGERVIARLRAIGEGPLVDVVGPMPYPDIYQLTEMGSLPGFFHTTRSGFMSGLSRETADTIMEHARRGPGPLALTQVRVLGGAMRRVPADATAFAHRDAEIWVTFIGMGTGEEIDGLDAWAQAAWESVKDQAPTIYVNFLRAEGEEGIARAYPEQTYRRLVEVKRRYDPTNLFRINQNVKP